MTLCSLSKTHIYFTSFIFYPSTKSKSLDLIKQNQHKDVRRAEYNQLREPRGRSSIEKKQTPERLPQAQKCHLRSLKKSHRKEGAPPRKEILANITLRARRGTLARDPRMAYKLLPHHGMRHECAAYPYQEADHRPYRICFLDGQPIRTGFVKG